MNKVIKTISFLSLAVIGGVFLGLGIDKDIAAMVVPGGIVLFVALWGLVDCS